jgi:hypothetical protein
MAAVPYVTLDDVLHNVNFQLEDSSGFAAVIVLIDAYRAANSGFLSNPLSQDEIDGMLKRLTGCVVGINSDMNCYPLGETDVRCFDLSGNPIP